MQAKKTVVTENLASLSLEESVSLWVDEEQRVDADQLNTPYGRQLWDKYQLIGDVLRDETLAVEPSDLFYARISKAIDEEPIVFAPTALKPQGWRRWAMPSAGLAAALVATLWFVQPSSLEDAAPVLASADEVWIDYIDAHRSLTGTSPASYVSYSVGN